MRACARTCTVPLTSWRRASDSLWKTCGQDDELAERISSALQNEYWRGLDRSPSPPVLYKEVPAPVGRFHFVVNAVRQRHFGHLARIIGPLRGPVAKRTAQPVGHHRLVRSRIDRRDDRRARESRRSMGNRNKLLDRLGAEQMTRLPPRRRSGRELCLPERFLPGSRAAGIRMSAPDFLR